MVLGAQVFQTGGSTDYFIKPSGTSKNIGGIGNPLVGTAKKSDQSMSYVNSTYIYNEISSALQNIQKTLKKMESYLPTNVQNAINNFFNDFLPPTSKSNIEYDIGLIMNIELLIAADPSLQLYIQQFKQQFKQQLQQLLQQYNSMPK